MEQEKSACDSCSSRTDGGCSGCGSAEHGHEDNTELDAQLRIMGRLRHIKHIIVVLSGKGGVGKSTVAVNIACGLAALNRRVGILDVDIHGPTVPRMMAVTGEQATSDGDSIVPVESFLDIKVMSLGFFIRNFDAVVWRGPLKMGVIKQFLADVNWGELDYLIIDAPPGTGDEPLSVVQLIATPANAIVVTTPQEVAIDAVRRSMTFCRTVGLKTLGIVENMSGFACPKCGTVFPPAVSGGENLAKEVGVPLLAKIPLSPEMMEGGDAGKPAVLTPGSASGKLFEELAAKIDKSLYGV